jgi:hypothetical protein
MLGQSIAEQHRKYKEQCPRWNWILWSQVQTASSRVSLRPHDQWDRRFYSESINWVEQFSLNSCYLIWSSKLKLNSMVWVRERTIPTERPPLVGEVIANFCGWRVPRGQRDGSLLPYSRFSTQEPLLFYQVAPQLYSRGWVDPVPDPLLSRPLHL